MTIEITQEDREAAANLMRHGSRPGISETIATHMSSGTVDSDPIIQAFAAHRQAARERALDEAAEVAERNAKHAGSVMMNDEIGITDARVGYQLANQRIASQIRKLKEG